MVILRLCFSLCYRPVLFFSLSFCLFFFNFALSFLQLFVYKWRISVLKQGVFLGQKGGGKNLLGFRPDPLLFPYSRAHGPLRFFQLERPLVLDGDNWLTDVLVAAQEELRSMVRDGQPARS